MTNNLDDFDSDLISIVAHDLKTPVSAARGFLDLVEHSGPINEMQLKFLERTRSSLSRMEKLIASLLDYARISSGIELERSVVDIHSLVLEAFELFKDIAAQHTITIHLQEDPKPVFALVDRRLLGHVISNLLSNAIKYNNENGEVWIEVSEQGETVRVEVRDNGMGINEYAQERVFDRFYRAVKKNKNGRIEGSGLGLAICQSIIDLHEGRIWVESTLGEGSKFSFIVPIQANEIAAESDLDASFPSDE
jgi:signal transduction histidine kinase